MWAMDRYTITFSVWMVHRPGVGLTLNCVCGTSL